MSTLSARDAYAEWAATYEPETAISFLENGLVRSLGVRTTARRLLDVGCGTGRRLRGADASFAAGVDASMEMLRRSDGDVAAADARALPFTDGAFDVVWCRLMIGHVASASAVYAELSRVVTSGGAVVVTDLASEAIRAGHRRTFSDAAGATHEVEHYVHDLDDHLASARVAGLELTEQRTGIVGPEIREFYDAARRLKAYEQQLGLPLVVALSFRKLRPHA